MDQEAQLQVPIHPLPLYPAALGKDGARAVYNRLDPKRGWLPDFDQLKSLSTQRARALVVIDPNNPTGAVFSDEVRRELLRFSEERGLVLLADEVYAELAFDRPVAPLASLAPEAAGFSFGSLSTGDLVPGWRVG